MIDRATNPTGARAQQPLTEEELNQTIHVPAASVGQILIKNLKKGEHQDFLEAECIARNIEIVKRANKQMHWPKTLLALRKHLAEREGTDPKSIKAFQPISTRAIPSRGSGVEISTEINNAEASQDDRREEIIERNSNGSFDEAVLNQSFGSMNIDATTPPRQRQFCTNRLDTTTEEGGNEIRHHNNEGLSENECTSIQSPNRRVIFDTFHNVLSSAKKKKKKSRQGRTPIQIRVSKSHQYESDQPRRVNIFPHE